MVHVYTKRTTASDWRQGVPLLAEEEDLYKILWYQVKIYTWR